MMQKKKALWSVLHILAIVCVLMSLLTGLRIAVLDHEYLLQFSHLLPQGQLHNLHFFSGLLFSLVMASYLFLRLKKQMYTLNDLKTRNLSIRYHIITGWMLYVVSILSLFSGWWLLLDVDLTSKSTVLWLHYLSALGFLVYLFLHAGIWYAERGMGILTRMFRPLSLMKPAMLLLGTLGLLTLVGWLVLERSAHHDLVIKQISDDEYIQIDGKATEDVWQQAESVKVMTHGGANFDDGSTAITVRAVRNNEEIFMHVQWQDPTESLNHLPLIKTEAGWKIKQNGFHEFNETKFYEDKLAIILSDSCEFAAAGTAHLGPKPLPNKPKHWSGKGYHYTEGQSSNVDLWHWKAVRTNHMRMMDDNYFTKPDIVRHGARRYTAGYKTDAKESGSYKLNWQWYKQDLVVPKRLPLNKEWLAPYQTGGDIKQAQAQAQAPGILPWFDGQPYKAELDDYPVGTMMPSVLYTSNQFEGDRANVRAFATWDDGRWSLELFRSLDTGSENDVAITDGICMWVAAFDQSQITHTRHGLPIKLKFY